MTPTEILHAACPHCAAGKPLRQRDSTREWIHEWKATPATQSHTLCLATHLRNDARFKEMIDGR